MNFQIPKNFCNDSFIYPSCPDFSGKFKTGVLSIVVDFFTFLFVFVSLHSL